MQRTIDVIHPLRKLAREIHRRSVWQVLGAYLVLAGLVYMGAEWATRLIGLPLWTPRMAFGLLAIGLPVVLATAVAQGGIPWLRIVDVADPNELEGRTPEQVHVVPSAHPLHGTSIFTWRNAILGGVMAGALLVASVVAYLAAWALGIGPVGSLVARGVISEHDTIFITDFESHAGDASFASSVGDLLRAHLSRSPRFTVLGGGEIAGARVPDSDGRQGSFDTGIALVLASRDGVKVIVDGGVARAGDGYAIHARIVLADGTPVARFDEMMTDEEGAERSVAILATRIRERLGESLRSIRANGPTRP